MNTLKKFTPCIYALILLFSGWILGIYYMTKTEACVATQQKLTNAELRGIERQTETFHKILFEDLTTKGY